MQLLDAGGHLLGGRDQQRAQPDRGRVVLDGGVEDRRDRHLLAEVDDRVAVVGEDRVDERLADVVDVAEHGGEHDRALGVALDLVEVAARAGRRRASSPRPTGARTGGSARRRRTCRRPPSSPAAAPSLSVGTAPIFSTLRSIQSSTPSFLRRRMWKCSASSGSMPSVGSALLARPPSAALGLEVGDEALERVLAAVEHEVVGELALVLGDLGVRRDVVGVDHRQVEPGLDAVVQEHAVEHAARRQADAERDVRDAERGLHAGDLGLDPRGSPRSSRPRSAATPRRRWSA